MYNQFPLAQYGLEEAIELQFVIWLENLCSQYTAQQPGGQQPLVKVASLYNKLLTPAYPFIGVRAYIPVWEPTNIGDYEQVDAATGSPVYTKINECMINLHLETKEYREIQRLYSFLQLMLEFSYDPLAFARTGIYESWLSQIRNWGVVINGWTANPVVPVTQDIDANSNTKQMDYSRTDVFTLYQRDINLNCLVATRVLLAPVTPIIEVDESFTITLPGP